LKNFSVNKLAYRRETIETALNGIGFVCFLLSILHLAFMAFIYCSDWSKTYVLSEYKT